MLGKEKKINTDSDRIQRLRSVAANNILDESVNILRRRPHVVVIEYTVLCTHGTPPKTTSSSCKRLYD